MARSFLSDHWPVRGASLVELMLALTLGSLIMLAGSALLVAANASYLQQSAAAQLNESALYGLDIVARAVRQSAFVNWDSGAAPLIVGPGDSPSVSGLDASSLSKNSAGIDAALAGADEVVNGSDVLALRYFGAGGGTGGDGSVLNCAGFGVGDADSVAERGWSIFYVARDSAGEAELRCKYRAAHGDGWGADAIVRGVDTFQVLYGVDTDQPPDGVANQYLNATAINVIDAALHASGVALAGQSRWKRVVSIKVALLLHGQSGSRGASLPTQFDLFGAAYSEADGASDVGVRIREQNLLPALRVRARRSMVSTISLRNTESD